MKYYIIILALLFTSCHKNLDLSQLDEVSKQQLRQTEALKITDDVTTAVMAAYHNNNLTREMTGRMLTVNKQIRDVIKAWPIDWPSRVQVIIKNFSDSLTPAEHLKIDAWLTVLGGIR